MSNFCDQTVVEFIAGKGGDGMVHFRREKHVARGGPDGGDGGNGGNIVLIADENINTLIDYDTKKIFRAHPGGNGKTNNASGANGNDLFLKMPVGTILKDYKSGEIITDLKKHGEEFIIASGGRGGFGNSNFKSSIHKAPQFAENGEEGKHKTVLLELQLVADIGIIGFPSAGKSTLIARISNAKPKIAAYPFTTLIPNLGVVNMKEYDKKENSSFVVADIPGLIEGAHKGKGLGHEFLRHISRTSLLVHLIDSTRNNVVQDYKIINKELEAHDQNLAKKDQIVVINKIDAVPQKTINKYKKELEKANPRLKHCIYCISALTGEGLKDLIFVIYRAVQQLRKILNEGEITIIPSEIEKVFRPHLEEKKFDIVYRRSKLESASKKTRKIFDVKGERIEQVVQMTDITNLEGLERIYHFLKKMGIQRELQKQGAHPGDKIRIAGKVIKMK